MYIGPWQEYRLNKEKEHARANKGKQENQNMHQNLISILEASLEPEAAKQAIEAIDPYLKNVSVERSREAQKNSNSSTTSFPRIVPKERRLRGYRNLRQKDHGSRERQILPLILSARSCHDNNGPPSNRSTMSSKSEPIQGSDYNSIEDKKKVDKSLNGNDEQNDASYDKSNVLDILRMERNAAKSKRSEHTSDFSSFWKWKNNGKPVPSSFRSIHNQKLLNKEIKNNKQDIDKMERVNKLKELYSGAVSINVDIRGNTHSVSSNDISTDQKNIQLSPIRHRPSFSKPSTPVVVDKDLTESDMAIVSKYFNKSKPDLHENLPSQNSLSNSPVVAPRSAHKSRNSLHMYSPNPSRSSRRRGNSRSQSPASKQSIGKYDNTENSENGDFNSDNGHVGGDEGLLEWCTNLNVDDIDNMY